MKVKPVGRLATHTQATTEYSTHTFKCQPLVPSVPIHIVVPKVALILQAQNTLYFL